MAIGRSVKKYTEDDKQEKLPSYITLSPSIKLILSPDTSKKQKKEVLKAFKDIVPGLEKILNK